MQGRKGESRDDDHECGENNITQGSVGIYNRSDIYCSGDMS